MGSVVGGSAPACFPCWPALRCDHHPGGAGTRESAWHVCAPMRTSSIKTAALVRPRLLPPAPGREEDPRPGYQTEPAPSGVIVL